MIGGCESPSRRPSCGAAPASLGARAGCTTAPELCGNALLTFKRCRESLFFYIFVDSNVVACSSILVADADKVTVARHPAVDDAADLSPCKRRNVYLDTVQETAVLLCATVVPPLFRRCAITFRSGIASWHIDDLSDSCFTA